ncbi:guanosine-5'-triphosphate,3'-diphosphate pyrophosphatase, partial [Vibrio parahaemolyticus]|nr:guanosine-5'-triphosphate,3'-diphosphate pyrophosphatase [Vibrio parahaemolyticus]
ELVASLAGKILEHSGGDEWFAEHQGKVLIESTEKLHEIGLTFDFIKGGDHSAYLLQNLDF